MADKSVYQSDTKEILAFDPIVNWHERVIKQVNEEYWAAWWFMRPKLEEWQNRLKLYNNQKRNKDRVGSPDIFSFHQVLLANLYEDQLRVKFSGREEEDDENADNLTTLAENDYDEMGLAELDYSWDFDSSLFGRGLLLMNDWDYDSHAPMAEVMDPLTCLRDPTAQSVNGNRMGQNGARFLGREIRRTTKELFESGDYFNLEFLRQDIQGFRTFSPLWDTERARKEAQGFQTPYQSYALSTNNEWTLLQWFTVIDGQKYMIELGNDRTLIIRMSKLGKKFPIIDRTMYPIAHDWDGVSVFDVMEDKQRFRAQLINVYGDAAKAMLYPMYLFDENKVRKNVDKDFDFDKWIPIDGNPENAVKPLPKADIGNEVNFMMDFLDRASQKALGISEISFGQQPSKKATLGQVQLQQAKMDARYSLAIKIWGWSEAARWRRWYEMYEDKFPGGVASKVLRVEGASGREYKKVKREEILVSHELGPHIDIETKSLSEARKLRKYQQMKDFYLAVVQLPETDKIYGARKLGEQVMKKKEVELLIPYTFDERYAQDENDDLNEGKPREVKVEDNHIVHLRIHDEAKDTPASEAHIRMHEYALMMKRQQPELFPQMTPEGQNPQEAQMASAAKIEDQKKKGEVMAKQPFEGINVEPKPL
jgi:hypothetical protein